jgi:hypothetical protein
LSLKGDPKTLFSTNLESLMDIHKPKTIHNWREFLKEYAIIVIGVLTALAAEQAVEWWHWKNRVADARAAMLLELRDEDAPQAYTRVAARDCFEQQLNNIQSAIEAERPRAEIATLISNYRVPTRSWRTASWDALLASDVASHISPEQLIQWSQQHDTVPHLAAIGAQEEQDLVALRVTRSTGERLAQNEADTILAAISRLRADNSKMWAIGMGLLSNLRGGGIEVAPEEQRRILTGLKALYPDCVATPSPFFGPPSLKDQLLGLRRRQLPGTRR